MKEIEDTLAILIKVIEKKNVERPFECLKKCMLHLDQAKLYLAVYRMNEEIPEEYEKIDRNLLA